MSQKTPKYIAIEVQIRDEQQIDEDGQKLPLLNGDMWRGTIDLSNSTIIGWPQGIEDCVYDKVGDLGSYYLLDENKNVIASIENNYVPNGCIPGTYGDYIDLEVSREGVVTNMPAELDFSKFNFEEN